LRNAVATAVAFEGGLALLALGVAALLGWPSPTAPAGRVDRSVEIQIVIGTLAALPMVGAFLLLERRPPGWFSDVRQEATRLAGSLFRRASVAQLLLVSAVAGIGEELLFRGLLIGSVSQGAGIGLPAALVLSSVVFGLAHPISRSYAVVAGVVGMYLGTTYLWSGGVLAPIVAHGLYDFVALWYLLRELSDDDVPDAGSQRLDEAETASGERSEEE